MKQRIIGALLAVVTLTLLIVSPVQALATEPAAGDSTAATEVLAGKGRCLNAPFPADPTEGPLGFLTPDLNATDAEGSGDPWDENNPDSMIGTYGFKVNFFTYDTGCFPGSAMMPSMATQMDNFGMSIIVFFEQLAYITLRFALDPSEWIGPIDSTVSTVSSIIREGVFTPWMGIGLLVAGAMSMIATIRGYISKTATGVIWAIAVLAVSSFLINYPTRAIEAFDSGLTSATEIITGASASDERSGAEVLDRQIDNIHRATVYEQWLASYFGDPDSEAAQEYGPRLFKATHLSLEEAELVKTADDDERTEFLQDKESEFNSVTDDMAETHEHLYDSKVSGFQFRVGNTVGAAVGSFSAMAFVMAAGIWIALSFIVLRLIVVFAPAFGPLAAVEAARPMVAMFGSKIGLMVIAGPLYFIAAMINLRLASALLTSSNLHLFVAIILCLVITIILWVLLKPLTAPVGAMTGGAVRRGGGLARLFMKRRMFRQEYRREDGTRMSRPERKIAKQENKDRKVAARTQLRESRTQEREDRSANRYAKKATRGMRFRNRASGVGEKAQAGHISRIVPGFRKKYRNAAELKSAERRSNEQAAHEKAKAEYLDRRGHLSIRRRSQTGTQESSGSTGRAENAPAAGARRDAGSGVSQGARSRRVASWDKSGTDEAHAAYARGPVVTKPRDPGNTDRGQKTANAPAPRRQEKQQTPSGGAAAGGVRSKWAAAASERPFAREQKPRVSSGAQSSGAQRMRSERTQFTLSPERRARVTKTAAAARGARK